VDELEIRPLPRRAEREPAHVAQAIDANADAHDAAPFSAIGAVWLPWALDYTISIAVGWG
jgi:hypothetical protein